MFGNSRYLTRGIQEQVGLDLQLLLWQLIDQCMEKGVNLDYMQIFELSTEIVGGQAVQIILHRQEEPPFQSVHRFAPIEEPLDKVKIWVIDDGDHSTMLLPSEY